MIHANEALQAGDYTDHKANQMTEIELEMYREAVEEAEEALEAVDSVIATGTARHPYLSETAQYAHISLFCVELSPVQIQHSNANHTGEFVSPEIYEKINEADLKVVDVSPTTQRVWDELEEEETNKQNLMLWCSLSR